MTCQVFLAVDKLDHGITAPTMVLTSWSRITFVSDTNWQDLLLHYQLAARAANESSDEHTVTEGNHFIRQGSRELVSFLVRYPGLRKRDCRLHSPCHIFLYASHISAESALAPEAPDCLSCALQTPDASKTTETNMKVVTKRRMSRFLVLDRATERIGKTVLALSVSQKGASITERSAILQFNEYWSAGFERQQPLVIKGTIAKISVCAKLLAFRACANRALAR